MYRMTKADMENEINSLKRGPDRTARRPPLLHDPTLGNPRNDNSPHLLPTPTNFPRHQGSPVNAHSYPMQSNFNQDSPIVCLRLRNIPYTTTEQQIYEYFGGQIEGCKILLDRFNRGAGEALIRFPDPQSCQLAYESKNRQTFFGRTLDLRPLSQNEFQAASVTPMLTANDLASPTTMNQHFQQPNSKRYPPYYERNDDRRNDKRPRWDGGQSKGNSRWDQPRESISVSEGYGYNRRGNKDEQGNEIDEKKSSFNDRRSSTPPVASATNIPPLPSELNEYVGRILFLSNVAYRATREEILDFLRPYSPIPDTLKIRCDVSGKPTGLGVVACETKAEATRAVAELNNQIFMSRKIFLHQR